MTDEPEVLFVGEKRDISLYPIMVIEDRYGGGYSGGKWIAIADSTRMENGRYRIIDVLESGANGGDGDAMAFWCEPPEWIAVGNTPDEATENLRNGVRPASTWVDNIAARHGDDVET